MDKAIPTIFNSTVLELDNSTLLELDNKTMFLTLVEPYISNYMTEHGHKKAEEVMEKLAASDLIKRSLDKCIANGYVPTVRELSAAVISAYWMLGFASQAKVNFASAFFLYALYKKHEALGLYPNEELFTMRLIELEQSGFH